jgi:hypothetical protein
MKKDTKWAGWRGRSKLGVRVIAAALATISPVSSALAFSFDTEDPDLKVRWDNTIKYNAGFRVKNPSQDVAATAGNPNVDGGDLNFKRGMINNRLDLLSELDVAYRRFGARLSGAAWYDAEYRKSSNDYPTAVPVPNNIAAMVGGKNNVFSPATKREMGGTGEIADAFIYGATDIGESTLTVRAGRHTQLYGETLFLGANGIAMAQGPVDLVKAYSMPNAQFKEIARPVGQVSSTLQINSDVSVGAYYQFEWRPMRTPAAGSYFSPADFIGTGGDLLLGPGGPANHREDAKGSNSGQFGFNAKFRVASVEYGVYAAQYHDKAPIAVLNMTETGAFGSGTYQQYYQKDIQTVGASFSTVFGESNVAGEMSVRHGMPLAPAGDLIINFNPAADNGKNAPYALGNTLHANLSTISVFSGTALWGGATLMGELAFNRLLSVTHNPTNPAFPNGVLNSTHTRNHLATRIVFQPEYYQVLPQVDLQVPISLGYGISGRSAMLQMAPEHGGDIGVGFNFDYQKTWKAGMQLTHYFGPSGPVVSLDPGNTSYASYKQYYHDRDFVTFSLQRTF